LLSDAQEAAEGAKARELNELKHDLRCIKYELKKLKCFGRIESELLTVSREVSSLFGEFDSLWPQVDWLTSELVSLLRGLRALGGDRPVAPPVAVRTRFLRADRVTGSVSLSASARLPSD
jgi:hypothetical protein